MRKDIIRRIAKAMAVVLIISTMSVSGTYADEITAEGYQMDETDETVSDPDLEKEPEPVSENKAEDLPVLKSAVKVLGNMEEATVSGEGMAETEQEVFFMPGEDMELGALSEDSEKALQALITSVPKKDEYYKLLLWFDKVKDWADANPTEDWTAKLSEYAANGKYEIGYTPMDKEKVWLYRDACLEMMREHINDPKNYWHQTKDGVLYIWSQEASEAHNWLEDAQKAKEIKEIIFKDFYTNKEFKPVCISEGEFEGCTSLPSFWTPSTVLRISENAFKGCSSLSTIYFNTELIEIGGSAFKDCTAIRTIANTDGVMPANITTIRDSAFENCTSFQTIEIGYGVLSIGEGCFRGCTSLQKVITHLKLEDIGDYAFSGCTSLTDVSLAEGNLETIGGGAFAGCTSLTGITIPSTVATIRSGDPGAFEGCKYLRAITFNDPSKLAIIGDNAFKGCEVLESLNIPDSVTSLGASAYEGCNTLKEANLGVNITVIGEGTFKDCINLNKLKIDGNLTEIPNEAFSGCVRLNEVTLEDEITIIGENAFYNCRDIKDIEIPVNVLFIKEGAFNNCLSLENLTFAEGAKLKTIEEAAFSGCGSIKELTIPGDTVTIGERAFSECTSLRKIYGGTGIVTLSGNVFEVSGGYDYNDGTNDLKTTVFDHSARMLSKYDWQGDNRIPGIHAFLDTQGGKCRKDYVALAYRGEYGDLPEATLDKWYFNGWYTQPSGGNKIISTNRVTATDDITVYAQWLKVVNVTFDPQGGKCRTASQNYVHTHTYGSFPTPTYGNLVFLGWYTAKEEGTRLTESMVVNTDKDFKAYAHWSKIIGVNVTFDPCGGTIVGERMKTVLQGKKYGDLPTATYEKHTFKGWYTFPYQGELITKDTIVQAPSQNIVLYAQWDKEISTDPLSVNQANYTSGILSPGKTAVPLGTKWFIYPQLIIDKIYVSDKSIAKVKESKDDNSMKIKAKKTGEVNIVVESIDGKTELYQLYIEKPRLRKKALRIKGFAGTGTVSVNQAYYLNTVYLKPTKVTTSNKVVADLKEDGTIVLQNIGKSKIVCYFGKKKVKTTAKVK